MFEMNDLTILNDTIECSCEVCVSACKQKPGWFLPEEIKIVADYLGLTEQELFDKYLSVDYFAIGPDENEKDQSKYVLSPTTVDNPAGEMFPLVPTGQCIFLKDGKCSIHAVKPFECRIYDHRNLYDGNYHEKVADAWIVHRDKIVELLGKEPEVETPSLLDILSLLGGIR